MKKQKLILEVEEALRTEEMVVSLYMRHLKALAGRFALEKPQREEIQSLVEIMIDDSLDHKAACEKILEKLKIEVKDDI